MYARLAQSVERKALNLVVVGSSPTVGVSACESAEFTARGLRRRQNIDERLTMASLCLSLYCTKP